MRITFLGRKLFFLFLGMENIFLFLPFFSLKKLIDSVTRSSFFNAGGQDEGITPSLFYAVCFSFPVLLKKLKKIFPLIIQ